MCERLLSVVALSLIVLVLSSSAPASSTFPWLDPGLLGWWTLDEGAGSLAGDSSGHGNDGTLMGDPGWVSGLIGGALALDGDDDQIKLKSVFVTLGSSSNTVAAWAKIPRAGSEGLGATERVGIILGNYADTPNTNWELHSAGQMRLYWNGGQVNAYGTTDLRDNQWHHLTWVRDKQANACYMYIDGRLEATHPSAGADITFTTSHVIGGDNRANPPNFHGLLDDVQVYSRALLPEEIETVMKGPVDYRRPSSPQPADEAVDVPAEGVVLGWSAGVYAATHDVYVGTSRADPRDVLVSRGQSATTYGLGRLAFGQTYYWRVDEVNAPPTSTIFTGKIWQFTVEPMGYELGAERITATASSASKAEEGPDKTIGGVGLDAQDSHSVDTTQMWLSGAVAPGESAWIQYEFDRVYALHQMLIWNHNAMTEPLIGLGIKEAVIEYSLDGQTWMPLGQGHIFSRAAGESNYAANTILDFGGAAVRFVRVTAISNWGGLLKQYGLSEVRFLYIPMSARQPTPAAGVTELEPQLTLRWRPGRQAARHEVYLSTDPQQVLDGTAPVVSVSQPVWATGALDLDRTYYWKVNEVNEAAAVGVWEGNLWSFSTREYLIVDDFETYADDEGNRIYETWIDGWENKTGAQVGYLEAPFAERMIVRSGRQSMPLMYTNAAAPFYSEAERFFDAPQDWTLYGIRTLSLYFRGAVDNEPGRLYLRIDNTKVMYDGDAADLAKPAWQPWNIDLSAVGGNLRSVRSLTIGVEGANAKGLLYFDDIRLYPRASERITPAEPDRANLVGWWTFDETAGSLARDQSGRGNDATLGVGDPRWVAGKIGGAFEFDGVRHQLTLASLLPVGSSSNTVTAWIKVPLAGSANLGATQRVGIVLGNYPDSPNTNWELHSAGQLRLHWNGGQIDARGTTDLRDDTWHHVAWIRDKATNTCSLYIAGRLEATHPSAGADITFNTTHKIGGDNRATGVPYFHGALDDLRVYSEALSPAEIAWLAGLRTPLHTPF